MDTKLDQLNFILSSVDAITVRLNSMDKKINEFENRHKFIFICDQYDTLSSCTYINRDDISQLWHDFHALQNDMKLKLSNDSLVEYMIDIKCRSLSLNMLFFGIPEGG